MNNLVISVDNLVSFVNSLVSFDQFGANETWQHTVLKKKRKDRRYTMEPLLAEQSDQT